jgi:hypothetical protein
MGRKKTERTVDGNFARKIKAQIKAEEKWLLIIEQDTILAKAGKTAPLVRDLVYLDDRDLGRPMDTVNHLHDKPLEVNVNVKLSEIIRGIRERKRNYERSGK